MRYISVSQVVVHIRAHSCTVCQYMHSSSAEHAPIDVLQGKEVSIIGDKDGVNYIKIGATGRVLSSGAYQRGI